jgi:hypothetical protein
MSAEKPVSGPAKAATFALDRIDSFKVGSPPPAIDKDLRAAIDAMMGRANKSDRPALLFLAAYKHLHPEHDADDVPSGWRPVDKNLCVALTERGLTLHGNITSYAENMGIKGQASSFSLFSRKPLGDILKMMQANKNAKAVLDYVAWLFAQSYREEAEPVDLGKGYLTFIRAEQVCLELLGKPTQGHIQQFLIAALLTAYHSDPGWEVRTHHPHGSDKSDKTAGDVEVFDDSEKLVEAYEVTVRPDWKNRKADLRAKAEANRPAAYILVCERTGDPDLEAPENLESFMTSVGGDIAVIDIRAFVSVLLVQLDSEGRKRALQTLQALVRDKDLCGVPDYIDLVDQILAKLVQF